MRYPRTLDRLDQSLGTGIHWPDATDNHAGYFNGTMAGFLSAAEETLRPMDQTQHFLGNMLIEIDRDEARVETYVIAYHGLNDDGAKATFIAGARYLDIMVKRDDEWRIQTRTLLIDWMKNIPDSPAWQEDLLDHVATGCRKPEDASFRHFKQIG